MKKGILWGAAITIGLAGGLWYLISQSDVAWWLGGAAVAPLLLLVLLREHQVREENGQPPPYYGGMGDGPWGPP